MFAIPKKKKTMSIRKLGDPVLHVQTVKIRKIDDDMRALGEILVETMFKADGCGLAAPQVGIPLRMAALNVGLPKDSGGVQALPLSPGERELCPLMPIVLVNPEIVSYSDTVETREEGCLSVPKIYCPVDRPASVLLKSDILGGGSVLLECSGLLARAIQHELDHLDGVVYVQKVKSPFFEEALPAFEKIAAKSGNKNYKIKRLV